MLYSIYDNHMCQLVVSKALVLLVIYTSPIEWKLNKYLESNNFRHEKVELRTLLRLKSVLMMIFGW